MRVIAGTARGTVLKAGRGLRIRPTSDRVREAIFSILGEKALNSNFLDLFAGSGALAIEALSRGAEAAVIVESSNRCIKIIRRNLDAAGLAKKAQIISSDAYKYLKAAVSQGIKFDIIAADPPYSREGDPESTKSGTLSHAKRTLLWLSENDMLKKNGIVFIEHSISEKLSCEGTLKPLSTREYGTTAVSFFGKK